MSESYKKEPEALKKKMEWLTIECEKSLHYFLLNFSTKEKKNNKKEKNMC